MSGNKMGVTTATCFVCGQGTSVQFHSQGKSKAQLLGQWRKKWSMSLCHVLQLSDSFQSIFNEASFCFNCQEAVCCAEFTVNAISRLQNEIGVIREELKGNFQSHYEILMQGRTELDATGKEEYKIIEDVIREIWIKVEPVEVNVDHIGGLEEHGINATFLIGDEFPRLDLADRLNNEQTTQNNNILDSDADESMLETPILSKVSAMCPGRTLRRSGRTIKPRVTWKKPTLDNSSDSGNDYEDNGDPDFNFSGTEMAVRNDDELPEQQTCVQMNQRNSGRNKKISPEKSFPIQISPKLGISGDDNLRNQFNFTCNQEFCRPHKLEFKFPTEVHEHILSVHDGVGQNTPFHCAECTGQYDSRRSLRRHVNSVHFKVNSSLVLSNHKWTLNCSICFKGFDLESKVKDHEILHVPETPYACVLCSEQNLNSAANLRRHVQSAHDGKKYWCNMEPCLSSFVAFCRPREMKSHFTSEHPEEDDQRIYHCTECPSRFKFSSILQQHAQTHSNIKDYLCRICGKTFGSERSLKQHERSFHKEVQMKSKCSLCMKSFEGATEVEEHESLHSNETPFRCVLCDKMLSTTLALQRHVTASHELLQFECAIGGCEAKFNTKSKLKHHLSNSHGKNKYECPHCPLCFYSPFDLRAHICVHTGEKPHSCPIAGCGRSFIKKYHLKKHIRNHHGSGPENRVECRICGKRFETKTYLARHEVRHGDARPFMCDICSATFKSKQNLQAHVKVHARNNGSNVKPRKAETPQVPVGPKM